MKTFVFLLVLSSTYIASVHSQSELSECADEDIYRVTTPQPTVSTTSAIVETDATETPETTEPAETQETTEAAETQETTEAAETTETPESTASTLSVAKSDGTTTRFDPVEAFITKLKAQKKLKKKQKEEREKLLRNQERALKKLERKQRAERKKLAAEFDTSGTTKNPNNDEESSDE